MQLNLEGKVIVVTGAAGGIGAAIFKALIKEGAVPIGVDLKEYRNSELKQMLGQGYDRNAQFYFYQADASDEQRMSYILKTFDQIHGLVNNAGLLGNDPMHGGRSLSGFDKLMTSHAKSAFVLTELCAPLMREGGSIVNMGSIESLIPAPDVVLYSTAKGALWNMTTSYANTLCVQNIRVNQVMPGRVATKANDEMEPEAQRLYYERRTALKRSVNPQEVADLTLFLLSERASAITGQNFVIDCGMSTFLVDESFMR